MRHRLSTPVYPVRRSSRRLVPRDGLSNLADRIAAALHAALDNQAAAAFSVLHTERGLAIGGPTDLRNPDRR